MKLRQQLGFQLGVFLAPRHALWWRAKDRPTKYKHPCDSRSRYRVCWGALCKCTAALGEG